MGWFANNKHYIKFWVTMLVAMYDLFGHIALYADKIGGDRYGCCESHTVGTEYCPSSREKILPRSKTHLICKDYTSGSFVGSVANGMIWVCHGNAQTKEDCGTPCICACKRTPSNQNDITNSFRCFGHSFSETNYWNCNYMPTACASDTTVQQMNYWSYDRNSDHYNDDWLTLRLLIIFGFVLTMLKEGVRAMLIFVNVCFSKGQGLNLAGESPLMLILVLLKPNIMAEYYETLKKPNPQKYRVILGNLLCANILGTVASALTLKLFGADDTFAILALIGSIVSIFKSLYDVRQENLAPAPASAQPVAASPVVGTGTQLAPV